MCAWRHIGQIARVTRKRVQKVKGKWKEENEVVYLATNITATQANP